MSAGLGTVTEFHIVLAIHVATVIATFGVIFARPLVFAAANRQDRRSLPLLHRIEYTVERVLVAPGAVVVVLTGAYMANWGVGRWGDFYVWWGICVVALIGAALVVVMIPTARRAETVAARDLLASPAGAVLLSGEYLALTRRLALVSGVLCALVLVTMLFMGLERPL
jgi:hypothetical protein